MTMMVMTSTSWVFEPLKNILGIPVPSIIELIVNQTYVSKFKVYFK